MRLFVYEYTCAVGVAAPESLRRQGWAMLSALLEDFAHVPGIETVTLLDKSGDRPGPAGAGRHVRAQDEEWTFRELSREADYTLLVAPEFDDLLLTRCRWVEEAGGRLLGPSPASVKLTADKWSLFRCLRDHGVRTPETDLFLTGEGPPASSLSVVLKPRYGAGSQATFLVRCSDELDRCIEQAHAEGWAGEFVVQPFVAGRPASVAFLVGPKSLVPMLSAAQTLSPDGRFHCLGGTVPLPQDLAGRAVRLAKRAIEVVAGLRGYVGVDVVLGAANDGRGDSVIEMNPRPTTSYIGLRALAASNLAEALLRVATGNEVPPLTWRPGVAHFQVDGMVTVEEPGARAMKARPR
jgi:predicted ATP-grasp superfamily ATP-dependent carboligase